jgi:4-hydroxymandelate oxidase
MTRASACASEPLASPISLADYARLASELADSAVWDFIAGGSEDEATLAMNAGAYRRWTLRPRILTGVDRCHLAIDLFGTRLPSPILLAPIGYQGLVHEDAEVETARGAAAARALMVVSTMSNRSLEEIAAAGDAPRWFQLYVMKDRELTLSLVRRAEEAGYRALVVTVDVIRMGRRERDLRNGFVLPSHLRPGNLPRATDLDLHRHEGGRSAVAEHANQAFDSALSWKTIDWLRTHTRLPVVIKGVLTQDDAVRAVDHGASSRTTVAASSTARLQRSTPCRRSPTRSGRSAGSCSTEEFGAVPMPSRRERLARTRS